MTLYPDTVPADDRGLAYGDGCFETLRVVAGKAPLGERHAARMIEGAKRLRIPLDPLCWWSALDSVLGENESADGVIKLILTRGSGGRGYRPPAESAPRLLAQWHPWRPLPGDSYTGGLVLGIAATRMADQPALAGVKHLNRLEQVLARDEASRQGWDDALLLDARGRPLELTSMNLMAVVEGRLWTPPLTQAGVAGVMRGYVKDVLAPRLGLTVVEKTVPLERLKRAAEVMACNSVAGVVPVRKLGLWRWSVGDVTRRLQHEVEALFQA